MRLFNASVSTDRATGKVVDTFDILREDGTQVPESSFDALRQVIVLLLNPRKTSRSTMPRRSFVFSSCTWSETDADWPASARATEHSLCRIERTVAGAHRPLASGPMTYLAPTGGMAAAAALAAPERLVVCGVGDGGFMMTGLELATALQHGGRPIVLVFNNGMYGTIRMHQEREHPTRIVGTDLANPDFAALAQAMGAHAETVTRTADFLPAFERARQSGRAALIELAMDPERVSTRLTLSGVREKAMAAKGGGLP